MLTHDKQLVIRSDPFSGIEHRFPAWNKHESTGTLRLHFLHFQIPLSYELTHLPLGELIDTFQELVLPEQ
jgi:hypothetical protein